MRSVWRYAASSSSATTARCSPEPSDIGRVGDADIATHRYQLVVPYGSSECARCGGTPQARHRRRPRVAHPSHPISEGSEMLTSQRIDTNSLFLTDHLNALGVEVRRKLVIGDDRALLTRAI